MKEAQWMIDQLVLQGVSDFCIAPGSRSTPLAIAAAEHAGARTLVHFDERGLGFYALGLSQGSNRPAALIVTSGTAVGNLFPSVMEAHHSSIPLILLTADRPPELRDCGANQASDQIKLFGSFVRWQTDLPCSLNESYFRSSMAQAYFHAVQNPPGPVQINCQFREPRVPHPAPQNGAPLQFVFSKLKPDTSQLQNWTSRSRGVIVIGRLPKTEDLLSILELAERLQWPVFADLLSNARCQSTPEQIRHYDWIFKRGVDLKPDLILHFGERLTSKKALDWLKEIQPCEIVHIGPRPNLLDASRILTARVQADASEFCSAFSAQTDPAWLPSWKEIDREIDDLIESHFLEDFPFTEAHAMRAIGKILPPHIPVFLGNGMPIRDADHFLFPEKCAKFFVNRGLSGIDGNIATAAGLSDGLNLPLLAFIGDQACLHDLNSLPLLKKTKHPVILIASNNFGSGMFSHLPVANSPHFDRLFAAKHEWRFEEAAKMFHLPYTYVDSDPTEALKTAFRSGESAVIEMITDRAENYRTQHSLTEKCSIQFA